MLVANSFDLWQKDTFFPAAEEVQHSADIMESAYRTWLRAKKEGVTAQYVDELSRELQMALSTAKWQLDEFERAVRQSYRTRAEEVTMTRHKQFVSAIEEQIARAEAALKESYALEKKQPFMWVNLDKDERDDFALFLSSGSSNSMDSDSKKLGGSTTSSSQEGTPKRYDVRLDSEAGEMKILNQAFEEVVRGEEKVCEESSSHGAQSLPALEIVIDSGCGPRNDALVEATPKEKGSKPFFLRSSNGGVIKYTKLKMMNLMNEISRCVPRSQRQEQVLSVVLPFNSMRLILALVLTIFLVVPFMLYLN